MRDGNYDKWKRKITSKLYSKEKVKNCGSRVTKNRILLKQFKIQKHVVSLFTPVSSPIDALFSELIKCMHERFGNINMSI